MKILSIDPGKQLGWCILEDGKPKTWGLTQNTSKTASAGIVAALWSLLAKVIDNEIDTVVYERPPAVFRNAHALSFLVDEIGRVMRIFKDLTVVQYYPSTWRKHLGLKSNKKDPKKPTADYLKKMGFKIADDNIADAVAIGLAYWEDINGKKTVVKKKSNKRKLAKTKVGKRNAK